MLPLPIEVNLANQSMIIPVKRSICQQNAFCSQLFIVRLMRRPATVQHIPCILDELPFSSVISPFEERPVSSPTNGRHVPHINIYIYTYIYI